MADIIGHDWIVNGYTSTEEEAVTEMNRRHQINKNIKRQQQQEVSNEKIKRGGREDFDFTQERQMKEIDLEDFPDYGVFSAV